MWLNEHTNYGKIKLIPKNREFYLRDFLMTTRYTRAKEKCTNCLYGNKHLGSKVEAERLRELLKTAERPFCCHEYGAWELGRDTGNRVVCASYARMAGKGGTGGEFGRVVETEVGLRLELEVALELEVEREYGSRKRDFDRMNELGKLPEGALF